MNKREFIVLSSDEEVDSKQPSKELRHVKQAVSFRSQNAHRYNKNIHSTARLSSYNSFLNKKPRDNSNSGVKYIHVKDFQKPNQRKFPEVVDVETSSNRNTMPTIVSVRSMAKSHPGPVLPMDVNMDVGTVDSVTGLPLFKKHKPNDTSSWINPFTTGEMIKLPLQQTKTKIKKAQIKVNKPSSTSVFLNQTYKKPVSSMHSIMETINACASNGVKIDCANIVETLDSSLPSVSVENSTAKQQAPVHNAQTTPSTSSYREFIEIFSSHETRKEDRDKVLSKLNKHFNACGSEYTESQEFNVLLQGLLKTIQDNKHMIYFALKEVLDNLKAKEKVKQHRKGKRAQLVSVPKEGSGNVEDQVEESFLPEEERFAITADLNPRQGRMVRGLSKTLRKLEKKIRSLEEAEVDLDDEIGSTYLQMQRYRERYAKVHKKLCQITEQSSDAGRNYKQRISFNGTKYPAVNKAIEKWLNKTRQFPDFADIIKLVESHSVSVGKHFTPESIHMMARDAFAEVGNLLQRRRRYDLWDSCCDILGNSKDPADTNTELKKVLDDNFRLYKAKEEEIFNAFVEKQVKEKVMPVEVADEEADLSPLESGDEDEMEIEEAEKGIMLGAYDEEQEADDHDAKLGSKESKNNFKNCKSRRRQNAEHGDKKKIDKTEKADKAQDVEPRCTEVPKPSSSDNSRDDRLVIDESAEQLASEVVAEPTQAPRPNQTPEPQRRYLVDHSNENECFIIDTTPKKKGVQQNKMSHHKFGASGRNGVRVPPVNTTDCEVIEIDLADEKSSEKSHMKPAVKPTEKPPVKPTEKPTEKPAEKHAIRVFDVNHCIVSVADECRPFAVLNKLHSRKSKIRRKTFKKGGFFDKGLVFGVYGKDAENENPITWKVSRHDRVRRRDVRLAEKSEELSSKYHGVRKRLDAFFTNAVSSILELQLQCQDQMKKCADHNNEGNSPGQAEGTEHDDGEAAGHDNDSEEAEDEREGSANASNGGSGDDGEDGNGSGDDGGDWEDKEEQDDGEAESEDEEKAKTEVQDSAGQDKTEQYGEQRGENWSHSLETYDEEEDGGDPYADELEEEEEDEQAAEEEEEEGDNKKSNVEDAQDEDDYENKEDDEAQEPEDFGDMVEGEGYENREDGRVETPETGEPDEHGDDHMDTEGYTDGTYGENKPSEGDGEYEEDKREGEENEEGEEEEEDEDVEDEEDMGPMYNVQCDYDNGEEDMCADKNNTENSEGHIEEEEESRKDGLSDKEDIEDSGSERLNEEEEDDESEKEEDMETNEEEDNEKKEKENKVCTDDSQSERSAQKKRLSENDNELDTGDEEQDPLNNALSEDEQTNKKEKDGGQTDSEEADDEKTGHVNKETIKGEAAHADGAETDSAEPKSTSGIKQELAEDEEGEESEKGTDEAKERSERNEIGPYTVIVKKEPGDKADQDGTAEGTAEGSADGEGSSGNQQDTEEAAANEEEMESTAVDVNVLIKEEVNLPEDTNDKPMLDLDVTSEREYEDDSAVDIARLRAQSTVTIRKRKQEIVPEVEVISEKKTRVSSVNPVLKDLRVDESVKKFLQNNTSISITKLPKVARSKPMSESAIQALAALKKLKNISTTRVSRPVPKEDDIQVIGQSRLPQNSQGQNRPGLMRNGNRPLGRGGLPPGRRGMHQAMPVIASVQSITAHTPQIVTVQGNAPGFSPRAPMRGFRPGAPMFGGRPVRPFRPGMPQMMRRPYNPNMASNSRGLPSPQRKMNPGAVRGARRPAGGVDPRKKVEYVVLE